MHFIRFVDPHIPSDVQYLVAIPIEIWRKRGLGLFFLSFRNKHFLNEYIQMARIVTIMGLHHIKYF